MNAKIRGPLRRIVGSFSINGLSSGAVLECGHHDYRSWSRRREQKRRCRECGEIDRMRCASVSDQGLRCGLDVGHDGNHHALIPDNTLWRRRQRELGPAYSEQAPKGGGENAG